MAIFMTRKKVGYLFILLNIVYAIILYNNNYSHYEEMTFLNSIFAISVFIYGIWHIDKDKRKPFYWWILSAFLLLLGDFLYSLEGSVYDSDMIPRICDLFYITNTITCYIAIVYYFRQHYIIPSINVLLDIFIATVAATSLIYCFIVLPAPGIEDISVVQQIILLSYPIFDISYLMWIFVLFFCTTEQKFFSANNILLTSAFILSFIVDQEWVLFSLYSDSLDEFLIDKIDAIFSLLASYCYPIISLVALETANNNNKISPQTINLTMWDYFRTIAPYVLVFTSLVLITTCYYVTNPMFLSAIVPLLLLSVRQIIMNIHDKKLIKMTQQSREIIKRQNVELKRLNSVMEYNANIDFLTKIYNRRAIDKKLEEAKPSLNEKRSIGLLLIDVDKFKEINDNYGHDTGDFTLKTVAQAISNSVYGDGIAGRFGGDEFIVIIPDADKSVIQFTANLIMEYIREDAFLGEIGVTLSIGGRIWYGSGKEYDANAIIQEADHALYDAKENGRNQFRLFTEDEQ